VRRSIQRRGAWTQEEGCSRGEENHAVCAAEATQWIRSRSSSSRRALLCGLSAEKGVETPNGRTSIPHVYAGGDIATGAATVIEAMGSAKKAAAAIDAMLKGE